MRKETVITGILWLISIMLMGVCLFLSWQKGDDTVGLSGTIAVAVKRVIYIFGIEIDLNILHLWLRKAAHVLVFFVAGILFYCSFWRSMPDGNHRGMYSFLVSVLLCSIFAVIAEVGKLWIPGRHLQWSETLLNVIGIVCGAGITGLIHLARYHT